LDIEAVDRMVHETVIKRFDHHDLNRDSAFETSTTTGENLVILIWDLLAATMPAGELRKVGIIETRDNYFEMSHP